MPNNDSENMNITPEEFSKMNSEEKIMKMAGGLVSPPGKKENDVLQSLLNKIENTKPKKTINFTRYLQAAAAIIIMILGIYGVTSNLSNEKAATDFAEQTEITLPDSSHVILNARSKIIWSRKHFAKKRLITMNGEAFFDVKKGNEFVIDTKNGTVEILGTQLNVFSRENEFWVSCISGKVRVNSKNEQQIILPGEMVELTSSGLLKTSKNNIEQTVSWRKGDFYFEDKPLVSIFAELERQFNVTIEYKGMEDRLITVGFSNNNLEKALDIVSISMELGYEIQKNQKVLIYDKQK